MRDLPLDRILLVYGLFLLILAQRQWNTFRSRFPNIQYTFRITDIWASMLGFIPSIVAFADSIQSYEQTMTFQTIDWIWPLLGVPAQIFGAYLGFMYAAEQKQSETRLRSTVMIIAYTLSGILLGIVVAFISLLLSLVQVFCYLAITAQCAVLLVMFSTPQNTKP